MADGIPQCDIDDANDMIVSVISGYVPLKKAGKNYHACCPFHKERSPSFTVNEAKRMYYCFGCGAGGDAIQFVMEIENIGFRDAYQKIANKLPQDRSAIRATRQSIALAKYPDSDKRNPQKALDDLSRATEADHHPALTRHNTASHWPLFVLGGMIALPMCDESGELVNVAAIAADGRVFYSAGGVSYGATHRLLARVEPEICVLCMDYFDAWRMWWKLRGEAEIRVCVSPENFIWMTRKAKDEFSHVAVMEEDAEEFRELGFDVLVVDSEYR